MSLATRRRRSRAGTTTNALTLADRLLRANLRRRGVLGHWARTPTGDVHVLDASGSGQLPPVVLLHGLASSGADFARLLERLRPHVQRVIAPDLPGHGPSDAPAGGFTPQDLAASTVAVLDAISTEPALLFGNSMGGYLALRYALSRPEAVHSLMVASPAGAPSSEAMLREFLDGFRVDRLADASAFMRRVLARPRWYHRALSLGLRSRLRGGAIRALLRGVSTNDAFTPSELERLAVPTALVWGYHDQILPEAHYRFFATHLPRSTVIDRPQEFGHAPMLDDPCALARRILAFARAVDGGLLRRRQVEASQTRVP